MRQLPLSVVLILLLSPLNAQTGGDNTYEFLNLNHSAFAAATGGMTVSQGLGDLSLPYFNPALLDNSMNNDVSLNISTYFAGINYGYVSYGTTYKDLGTFAAGISFISYGRFTGSDAAGNISGTFTAAEYSLNLIYSRPIDSLFTVGINIKPVFSNLERYFSAGIYR